MKRFSEAFRFSAFATAFFALLVCAFKSYMANHYYDATIASALAFILADVGALTLRLEKPEKANKGITELVLSISSEIVNRLHDVRHMIGSNDLANVCREAFTVYDTLVSLVTKDKAKILIETSDGKRAEFVIFSPKSDDKPTSPPVDMSIANASFSPNCDEETVQAVVRKQFEDVAENLGTKTQIR